MASALEGTEKPLVTTSGTLMLMFAGITGRPGTEADYAAGGPRVDAENFVTGLAERGVRSSLVRLPPIVHSSLDHHGFLHILIGIARQSGVSAYVDDGANPWPSVHTLDAAQVYRLALEAAPAGSRLHAVAADLAAIQAMASALEGTEKPLVTTSGTLMLMFAGITGRPGTEADYAASRRRTRPSASPSSAGSSGWTTRPPVR